MSFEYESCPIGFSTPGALPGLPAGPARGLMVMYELRDARAAHRIMAARAGDLLSDVHEALRAKWRGDIIGGCALHLPEI